MGGLRVSQFNVVGAIHGVKDSYVVGGWVCGWLIVALTARVTLPLKFPNETPGTFVDNGVVIGLLVPIVASSPFLIEGPAYLVRSATRALLVSRTAIGMLVIGLNFSLAAGFMRFAGVPLRLVLGDALLGVALLVAGVGLLTPRVGWILPVAVFTVFTIPSLVPPDHNLLYRNLELDSLWEVAGTATVLAIAIYSTFGSVGLVGHVPVLREGATNDGMDWEI
jgi:hypothetical protein